MRRRHGLSGLARVVVLAACLATTAVSANAGADEAAPGSAACPPVSAGVSPTQESALARVARFRAPEGTLLACVAATPITATTFNHWALVAERSSSRPRHVSKHTVIQEVMGFLISSDWVLGEAAALGITVTEAQVRHRFEKIRHQQFPHRREFVRFLRSSGETVADLLFRVRLNILSSAVRQKALADVHGFARFIREFKAKWKAQTYCATAVAVADCGHVQTL